MTNPLEFLINGSRHTLTRPAALQDREGLVTLIRKHQLLHRHLDWRQPLDWLGSDPFWLMENSQYIEAALAIPPDPPGVAWIRLFACLNSLSVQDTWDNLLDNCMSFFRKQPATIAAIGLSDWFSRLLLHSGFSTYQEIVVLQADLAEGFKNIQPAPQTVIRPYQAGDFDRVLFVDQGSFENIWQVSASGMVYACQAAAYISVAEVEGKVVGYQLSTSSPLSAHLARLAVLPEYQHLGIGTALVQDLRNHFLQVEITELTVNTQSSNTASLHLYHKLGFKETEERFPVFTLS